MSYFMYYIRGLINTETANLEAIRKKIKKKIIQKIRKKMPL